MPQKKPSLNCLMQQEAAIASESCNLFHTVHCKKKKKSHDLDINVQACIRFMPRACKNSFVNAETVLTKSSGVNDLHMLLNESQFTGNVILPKPSRFLLESTSVKRIA